MRMLAAALVLLGACVSRDGVIDNSFDCAPGQAVSVDIALNAPGVAMEGTTDHFTMVVDVGNNSHADVEVTAIRVEPLQDDSASYVLDNSYRKFDKVLAGGESHAFELPIMGRGIVRSSTSLRRSDALGVVVSVYLANGDAYRCELYAPAPK